MNPAFRRLSIILIEIAGFYSNRDVGRRGKPPIRPCSSFGTSGSARYLRAVVVVIEDEKGPDWDVRALDCIYLSLRLTLANCLAASGRTFSMFSGVGSMLLISTMALAMPRIMICLSAFSALKACV